MGEILLVRHTEVALRWAHRCYGRSDIGLSRVGRRHARELATRLARKPVEVVIHSGLERAAFLAGRLAQLKRIESSIDTRWQERDFGGWEGRTWHSIWRETGNAMDGMLSSPHQFRPGGGETTAELVRRSVAAWHALPRDGLVVVVAHGGPIAAVRAMLSGAHITDVALYRTAEGSIVPIPRQLSPKD